MKKLLIGLILGGAVISSASADEWTYVGATNNGNMNMYISKPVKFGKNYRVWEKLVFDVPEYNDVQDKFFTEIQAYYEINCTYMSDKTISYTFYFVDGTIRKDKIPYTEWNYHAPNTIGYDALKLVCGK